MDAADVEYCAAQVRQVTPDLYLSDLLAPENQRPILFTLHAFHAEMLLIGRNTREPIAGEVRLQWWAEVCDGQRGGEAAGHPLARCLTHLVRHHDLSVASLDAKLQAHIFDLYNDPMGDRGMLEGYLGETQSMLFMNAALLAGASRDESLANACGHVGVAYGLVMLSAEIAWQRAHGRVYVPGDLLNAVGLTPAEFLAADTKAHVQAVQGMLDLAQEHLSSSEHALAKLPAELRWIFRPMAVLPIYLRSMKNKPAALLEGWRTPSQWRRQWALWRY